MEKTLDEINALAEINAHIDAMQKNLSEQVDSIQRQLTDKLVAAKVSDLERQLADALNPYSAQMGQLVHIENGKTFYRVNGAFVPIEDIVEALSQMGHSSVVTPGEKNEDCDCSSCGRCSDPDCGSPVFAQENRQDCDKDTGDK